MPRTFRNRLTTPKIKTLHKPGLYADGGGLYLRIRESGVSWVFRYRSRAKGTLRDKGLGVLADVGLALARDKALALRRQLLDGVDPIDNAHEQKRRAKLADAQRMTFAQCADRYIESHRAGWRNPKHAAQWTSTLNTYAAGLLALPVDAVDTSLVLRCLEPHWSTKAETMTRVRQRIEAVLDWAAARKYRSGENPARWRGHLDKILPKRSKVQRVVHHPALPVAEAEDFMRRLRARDGFGARCLELQILTATRPGEAAGAQWSEIDLDAAVWTIPARRMKADAEHRVPLSAPAVALLRGLPRIDDNVFPGQRGQPITTAAALNLAKSLRPGIVPHGFRSTFRDWAGDCTRYPREIIEAALAHTIKDKAEAAYRRGDALERRMHLMREWAAYCARPARSASVTPIRRKRG